MGWAELVTWAWSLEFRLGTVFAWVGSLALGCSGRAWPNGRVKLGWLHGFWLVAGFVVVSELGPVAWSWARIVYWGRGGKN